MRSCLKHTGWKLHKTEKARGKECHILAKFSLYSYISHNLCLVGMVILLCNLGSRVRAGQVIRVQEKYSANCKQAMIWGMWRGAFQKYNAVSPPGFKHFVIVKYFTAEGLKPHLARASAGASLNSICSRDWPWPCDFPVSTSPVLGFLGFTISPVVCGAGDRTQGLTILSKLSSNWATLRTPLYSISWGCKIITCFNIYLKLTKKYKVILSVVYLGSSKRQMDMAPTWSNCSLLSFSPHTAVSPTWLFFSSVICEICSWPSPYWLEMSIFPYIYFWELNPGPLSYTQA